MSDDDSLKAAKEKPEVQAIQVKVKDQQGNEVFFKIKRTTPMKKVFDAYCSTKGVKIEMLRFHFEGVRLQESDTPNSLEMDDSNMIDVFMEQLGGGHLGT